MESKTIIIATIGPASNNRETLSELVGVHMNMARLNFSWGTHQEHLEQIKTIREVASEHGIVIPIIQDLSGPRVEDGGGHHFSGDMKVITEKDRNDLYFGIENKIEYVALSFVGNKDDMIELKKLIKDKGGNQKVIAKIERKVAVENLISIIEESDGIMIARGDLGNEFPLEEIPFIQHRIIM